MFSVATKPAYFAATCLSGAICPTVTLMSLLKASSAEAKAEFKRRSINHVTRSHVTTLRVHLKGELQQKKKVPWPHKTTNPRINVGLKSSIHRNSDSFKRQLAPASKNITCFMIITEDRLIISFRSTITVKVKGQILKIHHPGHKLTVGDHFIKLSHVQKQFTVYKQLTRLVKHMIYCAE